MRRLLRAAAAAAVAMISCAPAPAQDYPTRSITLIVPYPAGGGVDALARVVAEKFSVALGQQVVVDNRAGGSALVGTRAAIKSQPDGYTLFLGHTGSIAINPNLYTNAGFDPRKDFAPIGLIAAMQVVLLAHPSFPASTIGEVVVVAKQSGAQLNIGTPPAGIPPIDRGPRTRPRGTAARCRPRLTAPSTRRPSRAGRARWPPLRRA